MITVPLSLFFLIITFTASTKKPEQFASSEARAFDFWIGDWNIRQKSFNRGTWLELDARTSVAPALDGLAIVEHWEGSVQFFWEGMQTAEPMKGLSVRSYDSQTSKWYIHWMDSRTPSFDTPYIGGFSAGKGEFFREWETPQGKRMGRITFSDITPGSVNWDLAISSDNGHSWTMLWIMEMSRVGS